MMSASEEQVMSLADVLRSEHIRTLKRHESLTPLKKEILAELNAQKQFEFSTTPARIGNWWYFVRFQHGREHSTTYRFPVQGRDDWTPPTMTEITEMSKLEVVVDDAEESADVTYYARSFTEISRDGSVVAFSVDVTGDENHELRIRPIGEAPGTVEVLKDVWPAFALHGDAESVFYVTTDATGRPNCVWKHRLGSEREGDELIYAEFDQRFWINVSTTRSGRFLRITANAHHSTECHLIDFDGPDSRPIPVWRRRDGVQYEVEHIQGPERAHLLVNKVDQDGAESIILADAKNPDDATRHASVRLSNPDATLVAVQPFKNHLAIAYRQDGYARVGAVELTDLPLPDGLTSVIITPRPIAPLPDPSTVYLGDNLDWRTPSIRVRATSLVAPSREYEYYPADSSTRLLQAVPQDATSGVQESAERRIWGEASDGTKIPVSLVAPLQLTSPVPFVVYGYGAYGVPSDPLYSPELQSLLKRGIGFAIVHVRGGGEYGPRWHEAGKLANKEQTFDDFVAGVSALVAQGWADPEKLLAEGHSAGGLLVGAVANRWPGLFRGIVAVAPFVDPLGTLEDPSQPLTASDWEEFGSPLVSSAMRRSIERYSPIQNVRRQPYPRILVEVGAMDTRVSPTEALTWATKLRNVGAEVDVLVNDAGHSGPSGEEGRASLAFQYAWIVDTLR